MGNFTTSDTKFPDLNGSMTTRGNNINTYHSNNLGDATSINNRPAPPPVSVVLTFSNGAQYTLCGRPSGSGFVGVAQQGTQSCSTSGLPGNGDDDWTATKEQPEGKPKPTPGKKPASKKKAAKKPASQKTASKKPVSKKAAKKPASKKVAKKPVSKKAPKKSASKKPVKKSASKKAAKKPASKKR